MERWRGILLAVSLTAALQPSHQSTIQERSREEIEKALETIEEVASNNMGQLCVTDAHRLLSVPVQTQRFKLVQEKADLAALLVEELALSRSVVGGQFTALPQLHTVVDVIAHSLLGSEKTLLAARVLAVNTSTALVASCAVWRRQKGGTEWREPSELRVNVEVPPGSPWYPSSGVFQEVAPNSFWTFPYYSCPARAWVISYTITIHIHKHGVSGYLSVDIDITRLGINQCDSLQENSSDMIQVFKGSHKCHKSTQCFYEEGERRWSRGSYVCRCKQGFYMAHPQVPFLGNLVEAAWLEKVSNGSSTYEESFRCEPCAPGCLNCTSRAPCLAVYNWPFRIALMSISGSCIFFTLCLIAYVYHHRRIKVFKVASPIFLCITLIGCAIMYSEMAAIFPILDMYSCIATKWTRHLGFCITYTALLMKTWRVSLTYRVKSAHKVKLTDKQLLQWMFPILLVMLIFLGTWTLSAPPRGEDIKDSVGLIFKQCSYNWWDHSIAIGEVLFLAWGIRVCYNVRNAESLFNEARLISYAIYNIALVNTAMVAFHLFLFPRAGPDIKYLLGFIRTQLSTTVTVVLVFAPKVIRVVRGQGDQWDKRARARAVTASFSLNGIGLVADETTDLYQENEELKEEIQKLASQIEFMKIVSMEVNNRHLKPKPGGYFTSGMLLQSPRTPREPSSNGGGCGAEGRDNV